MQIIGKFKYTCMIDKNFKNIHYKYNEKKLSIMIPVFNNQEALEELLSKLKKF